MGARTKPGVDEWLLDTTYQYFVWAVQPDWRRGVTVIVDAGNSTNTVDAQAQPATIGSNVAAYYQDLGLEELGPSAGVVVLRNPFGTLRAKSANALTGSIQVESDGLLVEVDTSGNRV